MRPPTSINIYVYIYIYCIWFKPTISILSVLMDVFGIYGIVIDLNDGSKFEAYGTTYVSI